MNKQLVILVAILFLFGVVSAWDVVISDCTELDGAGCPEGEECTYLLNQSVEASGDCFSITEDNIVLDCAGYDISGDDTGEAVNITASNVTVKNCNITDFYVGIYGFGDELNATNNTISSCEYGAVWFELGETHYVVENHISGTNWGIWVNNATDVNIFSNTVEESTTGLDIYTSGIGIEDVWDFSINGNDVSTSYTGIYAEDSNSGSITENDVHENYGQGILLYGDDSGTFDILISDNDVYNTTAYAVPVGGPTEVSDSGSGISLESVDGITIEENTIYDNEYAGIEGEDVTGSTICSNTLTDNVIYGIYLYAVEVGGGVAEVSGNDITSNDITGSDAPIELDSDTGSTVEDNAIECSAIISGGEPAGGIEGRVSLAGIALISGSGETVSGNTISECLAGVLLLEDSGSTVEDNVIKCTSMPVGEPDGEVEVLLVEGGISLSGSTGETVSGNTIDQCPTGIFLGSDTSDVGVTGNTITNALAGVYVGDSYLNIISSNIIQDVVYGLYVPCSAGNTFAYNKVTGAVYGYYGLCALEGGIDVPAERNLLHHNEFRDIDDYYIYDAAADTEAADYNTTAGEVAEGNYYDDIREWNITDANRDSYGDAGTDYPYGVNHGENQTKFYSAWCGSMLDGEPGSQPLNGYEDCGDFGPIIPRHAPSDDGTPPRNSNGESCEFSSDCNSFFCCRLAGPNYMTCQPSDEAQYCPGAVCTTDAECADTEKCDAGACVEVTGTCGYVSNHAWVSYACCEDAACGAGQVCENHACVAELECAVDTDCADTKKCDVGRCADVTGTCGYASGHQWLAYACCADADCSANQLCQNHSCVAQQAPPGGQQNATDALTAAQTAINQASGSGKNVTQAQDTLRQAQEAYNNGDYAEARRLAELAAQQASQAQAAPTGPTGPSANATGQPSAGAPAKGFDWMPWLIGLIVLLVIAGAIVLLGGGAWFLGRKKKGD